MQSRTILIADLKYKNPSFRRDRYTNISRDGICQIFTYTKVYGIKKVALTYPLFDNYQVPKKKVIIQDYLGEVELKIICVDLKETDIYKIKERLKSEILQ